MGGATSETYESGRYERGEGEYGARQMPIREERLSPHKQERRAGEVEVTKDVVEEQRTMRVPITHEEVTVERHPGQQRPADQFPEGETLRVPVTEEQAAVTKEPVVTGEVEIKKRPVTEEREFKETIRKEVPRVENKGDVKATEDLDEEREEG